VLKEKGEKYFLSSYNMKFVVGVTLAVVCDHIGVFIPEVNEEV
jgi:hypothetical protein